MCICIYVYYYYKYCYHYHCHKKYHHHNNYSIFIPQKTFTLIKWEFNMLKLVRILINTYARLIDLCITFDKQE